MVRATRLRILILAGSLAALEACSGGGGGGGNGALEQRQLSAGGQQRDVWTYVPPGLGRGAPLVLVFHETDGAGDDALRSSGAIALADAQQLVAMAPQARAMNAGDWDNHVAGQRFFETYPNTSPASNNDLQLVQAMIADAQQVHGSDAKRVYGLGLSNGAFFAVFTAATMPDQIAAFAEASGGLVTCPSTGSCTFSSGAGGTCDDLASQPGYCSCSGDEKPAPLPTTGRRPPGYLAHAADDTTVSVYYSCSLADRMLQLGYVSSVNIRPTGGHVWPPDFATTVWPFLTQQVLP